jgi:hypothetical protein
MDFALDTAVPVLSRTPRVLRALLEDLPAPFLAAHEGPDTWNPFDVVGHLIHGERTDWIPRVKHLLEHGEAVAFPVFDRFAQFEASKGSTLADLLSLFAELRADSLDQLSELHLTPRDLARRGLHPALGPVTLGQHLASWVVHDLDHVVQISRVMGKLYTEAVGPWRQYMRILGPA